MVEELPEKLPLRIWLDTGTNEPGWERARAFRDALVEKGWRLYDDLQYMEIEGADHSEGAWAERVDPALRFLFPPPPPKVRPSLLGNSGDSRVAPRPPLVLISLQPLPVNLEDVGESAGKFFILLKIEFALRVRPGQFARTVRMVRVVGDIMFQIRSAA